MIKECPICREDIRELIYVTICAHQFHPKCISNWLNRNNTCPICREPQTKLDVETTSIRDIDLAWFRENNRQQVHTIIRD